MFVFYLAFCGKLSVPEKKNYFSFQSFVLTRGAAPGFTDQGAGGESKLRQFSWPDDPPKIDVTSGFKNRRAARSVSCKMDAREFMVSSFLWPPLTRNCLSWIPEMLQSYWIIYFSRYIGKTEMFSTVLMAFSRQLRAMSWRVCRNFQYMCGSNFCFSWLLIQCNCQFK